MAIRERDERGEFSSLEDFCSRLDSRSSPIAKCWKAHQAGAFDFTRRDRAELFACIEDALCILRRSPARSVAGQVRSSMSKRMLPQQRGRQSITPWNDHEKLSYEKELLGFYVSGHPSTRMPTFRGEELSIDCLFGRA